MLAGSLRRSSQLTPANPVLLTESEGKNWSWVSLAGATGTGFDQVLPPSLDEIKSRLARLYKSGDIDVRECIVNGILEHLFERNDVAAYFIDWKADSELGQAYDDALLWSRPD